MVTPLDVTPSVDRIMWHTNAALAPGVAVLTSLFGLGVLANLLVAVVAAIGVEALCLRLRGRPLTPALDGSVVLTGALIALACPPGITLLPLVFAVVFGVGITKHAFGGIGRNLFNPAMAGYAAALVSFPVAFTVWPTPVDGVTAATALDSLKTLSGMTIADRWSAANGFGRFGGLGFETAAMAFAAGGAYLVWARFAAWRVIAGFLLGLSAAAALGYDAGSSDSGGSPLMHLFSGGTLLAVFFVLTDPVTHPSRPAAQFAFGLIAALVTYVIRLWGAYPDGIAFGVLLANGLTPLLERQALALAKARSRSDQPGEPP